jgi:large subunit ribosomal protein L30
MLYVTLRRGLAGKSKEYLKTLETLGLKRRLQVVEIPNNPASRGQISKVKHLVSVETAPQRAARIAAQEAKHAYREPLVFKHSEP